VPLPILGEADEIFQGRQPCLTVVDGRSFLVVNLTPAESRDGTTWGVTYLDLLQRGIRFQDLASDGGKGLLAGVREAQLAIPLRPDLFHLLREAGRLTQRLEKAAYKAIATAERARRAAQEAQGQRRRRGRPLKVQTPLSQAEVQEAQAVATFDAWCWLLGEIRQALEPITPAGRLVSVADTQATKELGHPQITAFADDLQEKLPQLLAPLEWLEQQLRPVLQGVDQETQAFILWAWQHRQELNLDMAADIPQELQAVVRVIWDILGCSTVPPVWRNRCTVGCARTCRSTGGCAGGCCPCCSCSGITTRLSGASGPGTALWNWPEWWMPPPWRKSWTDWCAPPQPSSRPDFFKVRKVSTYFPGKLNHPR